MVLIDTGDYWVARFLLQRGLAAIYLVAFLVAAQRFHERWRHRFRSGIHPRAHATEDSSATPPNPR